MTRLLTALLLAAIPQLALAAPPPHAVASLGRCNARMITEIQDQVRNLDRHNPGSSVADAEKRFSDIMAILTGLSEERGVVENVCSTDAERAPLFAQLGATAAWALALQSDVVPRLSDCPAAIKALQTTMLAQAWLDLANVVNDDTNGTVTPPVAEVQPKVQSRATAIALTLPAFHDTSHYWLTTTITAQQEAAKACPSAGPSPAPSSSLTPPARLLQTIRK